MSGSGKCEEGQNKEEQDDKRTSREGTCWMLAPLLYVLTGPHPGAGDGDD